MRKNTNIKIIGLIGVGVRPRAVVAGLLRKSGENIRIGAIHDPHGEAVQEALAKFGTSIKVCETVEELIRMPEIDWVFVSSFNSEHSRHAIAAMEAGKDVFCEKPLATTLDDALAVNDAITRTGRIFSFGLVLRYSPHYQKLKKHLSEGSIGRLVSMEFNETLDFNHGGHIFGNWRRHRRLSGGHILEKCCHDLDLANWIVDSPAARCASFGGLNFFLPENEKHMARIGVNAAGKQAYQTWNGHHPYSPFSSGADIIDNQVAILEYANGVRATFHTNCNTALPERRFYLCGTEGTIRADLVSGSVEIKRIGFDTQLQRFDSGTQENHGGGDEVMAEKLRDTILHNSPPLAGVAEGLQACVVAFALNEAMDTRRAVEIPALGVQLAPSHDSSPPDNIRPTNGRSMHSEDAEIPA